MSDIIDKLERLQKLRAEGALSEAEFAAQKAALLGTAQDATPPVDSPPMATPAPVPHHADFAAPSPGTALPWWLWVGGGVVALGFIVALVFLLMPPTTPVGPVTPKPTPSASAAPADPLAGLAPEVRRDLAEAAAWPNGRRFTNDDGSSIQYEPGTLVDAPFGPVLVSEGHVPDGAHVDSGHVGIFYLATQGRGYRVVKSLPDAIQSGSFGQMSALSVSDKFSSLPMVFAQGGGMWQGYGCSWITLTELQPGGPVEVVRFMDSASSTGALGDEEGEDISGEIANIVKDKSFDVRFTGSRSFTAHYVRQGAKYVLQGGEANALQGC